MPLAEMTLLQGCNDNDIICKCKYCSTVGHMEIAIDRWLLIAE